MRVLVACEFSGTVRDAFRMRGHDAVSCDLLDTEVPGPHIKGNVFDVLDLGWDLMIAQPPCTYLTCSAEWAYKNGPHHQRIEPGALVGAARRKARQEAIEFFMALANAPIPKICIENPVGIISKVWRKPDQYIQPYQYGHDESKKTGLWLKNLPLLEPTGPFVEPRLVNKNGKIYKRWGNQTDSGQNKLTPRDDRWKDRSRFWLGVAKAMAKQWGG